MLLEEALKDPSNKQFLLISDSDIPLYDPLTFYQQVRCVHVVRGLCCAARTSGAVVGRRSSCSTFLGSSSWCSTEGACQLHVHGVLCLTEHAAPAVIPPHPAVQLMHEDKSRTKACKAGPLSEYRWNRFMGVRALSK
jgi:hypothetical protein